MRHTTRADARADDSAIAETYAGTVPAPDAVAVSPTDAGTVSKPYDARALAGARRSYVAADDIAAVPGPVAAADARADEKSHTGADALVHMRVHRPQNDGHLVREQRVNCAPVYSELCAPSCVGPRAQANAVRRSVSRRLGRRPRPRRDRHCGRHRRRHGTDTRALDRAPSHVPTRARRRCRRRTFRFRRRRRGR